jgi:PilZ domain
MATETLVTEPQILSTRRFRRFKLDVPVRVIIQTEDCTRIVEGRGNELNEGGMAIQAGVELATDETVEIEFTPPYTSAPLRAHAQVRNRSGYRYGLEFLLDKPGDCERTMAIRIALQGMGKLM